MIQVYCSIKATLILVVLGDISIGASLMYACRSPKHGQQKCEDDQRLNCLKWKREQGTEFRKAERLSEQLLWVMFNVIYCIYVEWKS